jgi:hypothetical protein
LISGVLEYREFDYSQEFEDKDGGGKRQLEEILVERVQFLGARPEGAHPSKTWGSAGNFIINRSSGCENCYRTDVTKS